MNDFYFALKAFLLKLAMTMFFFFFLLKSLDLTQNVAHASLKSMEDIFGLICSSVNQQKISKTYFNQIQWVIGAMVKKMFLRIS